MKLSRTLGAVCVAILVVSAFSATTPATPPTVTIAVDATTAPRKIFHAKLTIPASPGDLTLYYPKWIPGEHAPDGPVIDLAGLKFFAAGKPLKWRRDLLDGFTLHVEVPAGVTEISAELDFLSPATFEGGFSAGSSATDKLAIISWNQVLLYPKGYKSDDINYSASLKLPEGWKFGTPLPVTSQSGNEIHFATVSLTTPTVQYQQNVWEVRGLPCGAHTLTVTSSLKKKQEIAVDAFDVWVDTCPFINLTLKPH